MIDAKLSAVATAAINKLYAFNTQRINEEEMKAAPPGNHLYHYTTAEGLKGIIENHEIWATSAYYLNDSAEIAYGCKVASEALGFSRQTQQVSPFAVTIAKMLQTVFDGDAWQLRAQPVFLVCFCEGDNLLSQWRYYGQSGGYSVGFEVPTPEIGVPPTMMPEPVIYTSKWAKVVYNKTEQLARCTKIMVTQNPKTRQLKS